jgi:hypothetical protein
MRACNIRIQQFHFLIPSFSATGQKIKYEEKALWDIVGSKAPKFLSVGIWSKS